MATEAKHVALTAPRSTKAILSESAPPEKVASSSPSPEQSSPAPPERTFAGPVFSHSGFFADPAITVPKDFLGVMGMPISAKGEIESENLTLACRNATFNMMTLLQERGFSREQAYVICGVVVDLRIFNVVDAPHFVMSALVQRRSSAVINSQASSSPAGGSLSPGHPS